MQRSHSQGDGKRGTALVTTAEATEVAPASMCVAIHPIREEDLSRFCPPTPRLGQPSLLGMATVLQVGHRVSLSALTEDAAGIRSPWKEEGRRRVVGPGASPAQVKEDSLQVSSRDPRAGLNLKKIQTQRASSCPVGLQKHEHEMIGQE